MKVGGKSPHTATLMGVDEFVHRPLGDHSREVNGGNGPIPVDVENVRSPQAHIEAMDERRPVRPRSMEGVENLFEVSNAERNPTAVIGHATSGDGSERGSTTKWFYRTTSTSRSRTSSSGTT